MEDEQGMWIVDTIELCIDYATRVRGHVKWEHYKLVEHKKMDKKKNSIKLYYVLSCSLALFLI